LSFKPGLTENDVILEVGLLIGREFVTGEDFKGRWMYGENPSCTEATDAQIAEYPMNVVPAKIQSEAEQKDAMLRSTAWKQIAARTRALGDHVEQYNLDSAKIVYAIEALSAVDETSKSLAALARSYK
jgi:hypothetical protein